MVSPRRTRKCLLRRYNKHKRLPNTVSTYARWTRPQPLQTALPHPRRALHTAYGDSDEYTSTAYVEYLSTSLRKRRDVPAVWLVHQTRESNSHTIFEGSHGDHLGAALKNGLEKESNMTFKIGRGNSVLVGKPSLAKCMGQHM